MITKREARMDDYDEGYKNGYLDGYEKAEADAAEEMKKILYEFTNFVIAESETNTKKIMEELEKLK